MVVQIRFLAFLKPLEQGLRILRILYFHRQRVDYRLLTIPKTFEAALVRSDCLTKSGLNRVYFRSPSFTNTISPRAPLQFPFLLIWAILFSLSFFLKDVLRACLPVSERCLIYKF